MDTFGPATAGTSVEFVDTVLPDGRRLRGEWLLPPGADRADAVIYYLHGSGYALCSPRTHRRSTAWLSELTGLPVFCVDYRLAPRHRFPAAADDVRTGWDWLQASNSANQIVVAGDSAGGHLAVNLLLQPQVATPACAVLFSPVADLTLTLAVARERLRRDPAARAATAARLVQLYGGDVDPKRLALDIAGGPQLPPTLIQAGGMEMLGADAHRLAADIRAAGGRCELRVWPDQVHVFQALPPLTPEAAKAMRRAASFIAESLRANTVEATQERTG
jgi:acetyl esterase/lipase